jgi:hypothetical protein
METPIQKDPSKPKNQKKTINLELAQIRVTRWLNAIAALPGYGDDPQSIPRAIFIAFDDINELVKEYPEKELKGIRIYFGLAGEDNPGKATVNDIRGLIVPVFYADKYRHHADLVKTDPKDPNSTSIYDFTTPCPVVCDFQSELYVPFPGTDN